MRSVCVLLVMSLLAGCLSEEGDGAPASQSNPDVEPVWNLTEAPTHEVGVGWTYEGYELYNSDSEFTVVVARADDNGYLFAGGQEDDLVYHALWVSPWYGERGRDMDPAGGDNILEFPLEDGNSWEWRAGRAVTARQQIIRTPLGEEEGFVIEGEKLRFTYSPSIGQIVQWERQYAGHMAESLNMTQIHTSIAPVWFVPGDLIDAYNPHEPKLFEVSHEDEAVLVSVGGWAESRAVITEPSGTRHMVEFDQPRETWKNLLLPATPGQWSASIVGKPFVDPASGQDLPVGWAYLHAMPVKWQTEE